MDKTNLLPTLTAVRMMWAMTGKFPKEESSKISAAYVEDELKSIVDQAANAGPEEKSYITAAVATMKSSLRSLDTIYKGREKNLTENEKLRDTYRETIEEKIKFGNSMKDFLKSLPTMTIGATGGLTLAKMLGLSDIYLFIFSLGLAAVGYLVNLMFVKQARRQTQKLLMAQDYEHTLYFDQYLRRVKLVLLSLFLDLERIHKKVFETNYESTKPQSVEKFIDEILKGVAPTYCTYAYKHMQEQKITPEMWAKCECGKEELNQLCEFWIAEAKKE